MSQDIRDFVTASCDLLALGEPTHQVPDFAQVRNELFAQLVDRGFRSIALETDRVAALTANDFVQEGVGTLDTAMSEGFTHNFGALDGNRQLITWMREYNENRPAAERLTFHGFDLQTENTSAPSPRRYLEYARDYLGLDVDIAGLIGDDERWSREEAVLDPAKSPGATAEAYRLRAIAADLLATLRTRERELAASTSDAAWSRAEVHLMAGIDLLRYHRQCAEPLELSGRLHLLLTTRDAVMARNLLDIRAAEAGRGGTLVFAHNLHLKPHPSTMEVGGTEITWLPAGALVGPLLGDGYAFIASSLGRSDAIALEEPEADTYEGFLQKHITTDWGLTPATAIPTADVRTDPTPRQGYFPLDRTILDTADGILHVTG